jgi:hypothetical protein
LTADEKIYRQLLQALKKWRIEKSSQEGPLKLMEKIRAVDQRLAAHVEPVLTSLIHARYGRGALSPTAASSLRRRIRSLRKFRR